MLESWTTALQTQNEGFKQKHPDTTSLIFDANAFLNGVMDNATATGEYGIKNITGYCASYDQPQINTDPGMYGCLPLDEYFWFNTGHLTSRVHEILAGEVGRFLEGVGK